MAMHSAGSIQCGSELAVSASRLRARRRADELLLSLVAMGFCGWGGLDGWFYFPGHEQLQRVDVLLHRRFGRLHLLGKLGIEGTDTQSAIGHRRDEHTAAGTNAEMVENGARQNEAD